MKKSIIHRFIAHALLICFIGHPLRVFSEVNTSEYYVHQDYLTQLDQINQNTVKDSLKTPEVQKALSAIDQMFEQLKNFHTAPKVEDPWLLKGQVIKDLSSGKEIQIDHSEKRSLLNTYVFKFEDQVEIKKNAQGDLIFEFFELKKNERLGVAQHIFTGMDVVKIAMDKELIHILRRNGHIYTISKSIAQEGSFSMPLPWSITAKVPTDIMQDILDKPEKINFEMMTTGSLPPRKEGHIALAKDAIVPHNIQSERFLFKAGDLLILNTETNKILGLYNREIAWTIMGQSSDAIAKIMKIFVENAIIKPGHYKEAPVYGNHPPTEQELKLVEKYKEHVRHANQNLIDKFIVEAYNNKFLSENPPQRDLFTYLEWKQGFEELFKNAQKNLERNKSKKEVKLESEMTTEKLRAKKAQEYNQILGEMRQKWQENIKRDVVKEKKMNPALKAGLWMLATVTALSAADFAAFAHAHGETPLWASWAIVKFQSLLPTGIFDIFLETSYIWTATKSVFWLLLALPMVEGLAYLAGKKLKMPKYVALSLGGVRFQAFLSTPLLMAYAKVFRQQNFSAALEAKLNPFQVIKKDSKLGEVLGLKEDIRLATNNFFASKASLKKSNLLNQQKQAIGLFKDQKNKKESLAWLLSALVVSKEKNIDPATLLYLFKKGVVKLTPEEFASESFRTEWTKTAIDLLYNLKDLDRLSQKDLAEVTIEDILKYKKEADLIAEKFADEKLRSKLKRSWTQFKMGSYEMLARNQNWEKLKFEVPSEAISRHTVTGFKEDYRLSAGLVIIAGARADMNNPLWLAADPVGPLSNTRPHLIDMIEQVFIYMVPAMAQNYLDYSSHDGEKYLKSKNIDPTYNPREDIILEGKSQQGDYLKSWAQFWKESFNLPKIRYGAIFHKRAITTLQNMRAKFLMGMPPMLIAGLDPVSAAFTFLWITAIGNWVGGWPWTVAIKGTMNAEEIYKERNHRLVDAKRDISQGIKQKDFSLVERGYLQLQGLYNEHGPFSSQEQKKVLKKFSKNALGQIDQNNRKSLSQLESVTKATLGLQVRIMQAIEANDQSAQKELTQSLLNLYSKHELPTQQLMAKDALALLKYSLKNPPVPKELHKKVPAMVMLLTGGVTTFLFSYMFANALDKESDALTRLLNDAFWGIGLYILTYQAQLHIIDPIGKTLKQRSEFKNFKQSKNIKVKACLNAFL